MIYKTMKNIFPIIFSIMAFSALKHSNQPHIINEGVQTRTQQDRLNRAMTHTQNLGKIQAKNELKVEERIHGYLTRNQNKRLPLLLEEMNKNQFAQMKNSSILKPMRDFFKKSLQIIQNQEESLKFNWFIYEIAENFKEMERNVVEVKGLSKTSNVPFRHYLRYKKVDTLKIQYNLDNFLLFSPQKEITHLKDQQKVAQTSLNILNSFIVIDFSDRYSYEVFSGEQIVGNYQRLSSLKQDTAPKDKKANNQPQLKRQKTAISPPLKFHDIDLINQRSMNFIQKVPKSKSAKAFFDFHESFINSNTQKQIIKCLPQMYNLYQKGANMYIGREKFSFKDKDNEYEVFGYLYRGIFYTTISKYIEAAQNCLVDHTNIKKSGIKELFQQLNQFELNYMQIDLLYRNKDYVEIHTFKFTDPNLSKSRKNLLMKQFYLLKFGKTYDEKMENDQKLVIYLRNKLINNFKDEKNIKDANIDDVYEDPQLDQLFDKSEQSTQNQRQVPQLIKKIQKNRNIKKRKIFSMRFQKKLIIKSKMVIPLVKVEKAYIKNRYAKNNSKFITYTKNLMKYYKLMLKNLLVYERTNSKKYQIVYKFTKTDYKNFFHIVAEIINYLNSLKSLGFKDLNVAFTQLQNSLYKFKITRNQAYEVRYFGEQGEEINEDMFIKGLTKNNLLKKIEVKKEESLEEESYEDVQNSEEDPHYLPSEELKKKQMKIEKEGQSSVDFSSEENNSNQISDYLPSEEKRQKQGKIEKKVQSSVDLNSEASENNDSEELESGKIKNKNQIININNDDSLVILTSEESESKGQNDISEYFPREEQRKQKMKIDKKFQSSVDLSSQQSSQNDISEYLPSQEKRKQKNGIEKTPQSSVDLNSEENNNDSEYVPSSKKQKKKIIQQKDDSSVILNSEQSDNLINDPDYLPSIDSEEHLLRKKSLKNVNLKPLSEQESITLEEEVDQNLSFTNLGGKKHKSIDDIREKISDLSQNKNIISNESSDKIDDLKEFIDVQKTLNLKELKKKPQQNVENEPKSISASNDDLKKNTKNDIIPSNEQSSSIRDEKTTPLEQIKKVDTFVKLSSLQSEDLSSEYLPKEKQLKKNELISSVEEKYVDHTHSIKNTSIEASHYSDNLDLSSDIIKGSQVEQELLDKKLQLERMPSLNIPDEEQISRQDSSQTFNKQDSNDQIRMPNSVLESYITSIKESDQKNLDLVSDHKDLKDPLEKKLVERSKLGSEVGIPKKSILSNDISGKSLINSHPVLDLSAEESQDDSIISRQNTHSIDQISKSQTNDDLLKNKKTKFIPSETEQESLNSNTVIEEQNILLNTDSEEEPQTSISLNSVQKFEIDNNVSNEENLIQKEPKQLRFNVSKIPLSGLKDSLENLELNGNIVVDQPNIIDEINEIWEDIDGELESYEVKIRKQQFQVYKLPTQKLMKFQNKLKDLGNQNENLQIFITPVTKVVFLNFLKLREHSYERILLQENGNKVQIPDDNMILPIDDLSKPDFKLDLEGIPESELKNITIDLFEDLDQNQDEINPELYPLIKILLKKLQKVLQDSKEGDADKQWFDVIEFPEDQFPLLEEVLDKILISYTPQNDKDNVSIKLAEISTKIGQLKKKPKQIQLKGNLEPVNETKEYDVSNPIQIEGPMKLDRIPQSKLFAPLVKLENFVAKRDSNILKDPIFLENYLKITQFFNDMLEPNTTDNIKQGKYLYDSDKFMDFLSEIENLSNFNDEYNETQIKEVIREIDTLNVFDIEREGVISEIFENSQLIEDQLQESLPKLDTFLPENQESLESSVDSNEQQPISTDSNPQFSNKPIEMYSDPSPRSQRFTESKEVSDESVEEQDPFIEESLQNKQGNLSFASLDKTKAIVKEFSSEELSQEESVKTKMNPVLFRESVQEPVEEPEIIRIVIVEIVDCYDCLKNEYIEL